MRHFAALAASALAILVLAERSGLDFAVASLAYDAGHASFGLRHDWWLAVPGHTGLKYASLALWFAVVAVAVAPARAPDKWRSIAREAAVSMAVSAAAVLLLRNASAHSCPWDLATFGGTGEWFALFASTPDQPGPGKCLPAAHPSTGFALFGLYFALRGDHARASRIVLAIAWVVGLAAGTVQVLRGAHFPSHVLWTAWVAWLAGWCVHRAWRAGAARPSPVSR